MRRALLLCSFALACGGGTDANRDGIVDGVRSPDSVSQIAPSSPVGTLSGQVLTTDFKPLEGVSVSVLLGGASDAEGNTFKTTTDNEGLWSVKLLPAAATAQVTLTKMGYATARVSAFVPGNAGNFPVNNGNGNVGTVLLTHLDGVYRLQVVTASGKPAKQHKVLLEVTPAAVRVQDFNAGYGAPLGLFVTDASTDDNGFVEFKDIPGIGEEARLNGNFAITIGAYDDDGDMRFDFLGTRLEHSAREIYLNVAPSVVTLASAHNAGALAVTASNVDSMINGPGDPLKSMIKMSDSVYFVFNQAVLASSISVKVTDETGTVPVMAAVQPKGPNILQVTLQAGAESGREYNLALRATSADNGSAFVRAAYFFGGDPTTPKPFAIEKVTYRRPASNPSTGMRLEPGDRVVVIFNQPIRNSGGQAVEVLIDADLNGDGMRRDQGEKSLAGTTTPNSNGFQAFPAEPIAEPMSTFANMASGYTTRFEFTYPGTLGPVGMAMATVSVPVSTQFVALFGEIPSSLFGHRTLWGTAVETDQVGLLSNP